MKIKEKAVQLVLIWDEENGRLQEPFIWYYPNQILKLKFSVFFNQNFE